VPLAIAATALAVSPPFSEPHLWQKLKLLVGGELEQSIDIFDFVLHASLIVLLALKLARQYELRRIGGR
jgi:hypothetical protein